MNSKENLEKNIFPMDADILPPSNDCKKILFNHEPHKPLEQDNIYFKQESFMINSCIYEVNRKLGTGLHLGILVNFNSFPKAGIIRIVR